MKDHQTCKDHKAIIFIFGDVLTDQHYQTFLLFILVENQRRRHCDILLIFILRKGKRWVTEKERQRSFSNHIWMTFLLFYKKHLIFCIDGSQF
jgi:hypothetical protein